MTTPTNMPDILMDVYKRKPQFMVGQLQDELDLEKLRLARMQDKLESVQEQLKWTQREYSNLYDRYEKSYRENEAKNKKIDDLEAKMEEMRVAHAKEIEKLKNGK